MIGAMLSFATASAQRTTDKLDRGLVAVKTNTGVFCSWRIYGEEYYDVTYNLYRDGEKVNSEPLRVSNFLDASGTASSQYSVSAVVRGEEKAQSKAVSVWADQFLEITLDHGSLTSTYVPNDACCADVDGDGELEILLKFDNQSEINASYPRGGYNGEYSIVEVYKLDGTKLWWLDFGPNMGDFQNNENNIVAYDWDGDGKAEALMRAADGTVIHAADGQDYVIGDKTKNYRGATGGGANWFMHEGAEYLVYMNGETGVPYVTMDYPLKRLEAGETDLNAAWGDGYGHRSTKHFFGAPYLDGRKPSIFLARGIYTRHKMIALDVNPATHELTTRWRWNCNTPGSKWYGNGYHNYAVADVDWDGRDEICFGSMVIDDNGKGLSTTGLGHGDAQHHGDFNPYVHGHEIFACNEDNPSNNYRDATTSKIYYRRAGGSDDGRCMAGNFTNDFPGAMAFSSHDEAISCVTNDHITGLTKSGLADNMRIYWDGDLLEECFNYTNGKNTAGGIFKYGRGLIKTLTGSMTNNDTKGTPSYQGDILGDWREEVIMRTRDNKLRIFTTTDPTPWRNYTLWHDMQYRQAMVWQMCGYNQPPHTSYFLGELERITVAPPPLTMTDRTEVANGGSIGTSLNGQQVLMAETNDMTVSVAEGASPYIFFDNSPSWVQGHDSYTIITTSTYTHTLTGGAFAGEMRLVKQGDGTLVLPNVTQLYKGSTDVWAGTLVFDGTMSESRVWLNRFAVLSSDGGKFNKGIQMDYASVLRPGGSEKAGSVETDSLILNFGSRVEFDVYSGAQVDHFKANVLSIEKKGWKNGPTYNTPVFEVIPHYAEGATALEEGRYLLGEVGKIEGSLDNIVVEGIGAQKANLAIEDGKIYLDIEGLREATSVTWTGTQGSDWDLADTENFKTTTSGESNIFVSGDVVIFNDDAENTNVNITQPVSPSAVFFQNETKEYTITGESMIGGMSITKTGAANVNIANVNSFEGDININGGRLTVASLANESGVNYGSLGGVQNKICLRNGGVLAGTGSLVNSQPIVLENGGGGIDVAKGQTFTTSSTITSSAKDNLTKTGSGNLQLGSKSSFGALYVMDGTVYGAEANNTHQYPDSVVLCGGTLRDPDNIYSYSTNNTTVMVPEGKSANWYLDSRCNYKGKLAGKGTLNVYATSVRNVINGNWNTFEGKLVIGASKTGSYDPVFYFGNSNGLSRADVNLRATFSSGSANDGVINASNSVSIGNLSGNGTLAGSGRYTIGFLNKDIPFSGKIDGCVITKVGSGVWTMNLPTNYGNGNAEVRGGALNLNNSAQSSLFFGTNQLIVSDSGTVAGYAYLQSVILQKGGSLTPGNYTSTYPVGSIKVKNSVMASSGSHVNFFIFSAANTSTSRSFLDVGTTLTIDGDINVTMKGYTPKEGDEIILWTASNFVGTPSAINLPDISEYGLAWDTSELCQPTGKLKVVDALGIQHIPATAQAHVEVYDLNGHFVGRFDAKRKDVALSLRRYGKGTYVLMMTGENKKETIKITVK